MKLTKAQRRLLTALAERRAGFDPTALSSPVRSMAERLAERGLVKMRPASMRVVSYRTAYCITEAGRAALEQRS